MKSSAKWLAPVLLLVAGFASGAEPAPATADKGKLVVHEWGTFLTVQGSDGVTLGGMIDSEEALPPFVRERDLYGRNRACFLSKMETPVTYFYVDRPRAVQVRVGMPGGLLTHWYPATETFGPPLPEESQKSKPSPAVTGSFLDWGQVELIPDYRSLGFSLVGPGFKAVDEKNTWRFARETDSAFVKVGPRARVPWPTGEWEKFLFYRGLGSFELPLQVRSSGEGDDVKFALQNARCKSNLAGVCLVRVEKGAIRFAMLPDVTFGSRPEYSLAAILSARQTLEQGVPQAKQAVVAALVKAGLYEKEARAMVNTWEHSYFRTEGLRLLAILPRDLTDEVIPIKIQPAPDELVRVMVGRVEILTPGVERRLEKAVADLAGRDPAARTAAREELAKLGRLKEPVLRRIEALTHEPLVRSEAQKQIRELGKRTQAGPDPGAGGDGARVRKVAEGEKCPRNSFDSQRQTF